MKKLVGSTLIISSLLFSSMAQASTQETVAQGIIETGMEYVGTPYQYGAPVGDTRSFDCSSFSQYVFGQHGINLPRTTTEQIKTGISIQRSQLQKGDLVFFDTDYDGIVNHLGVYVGHGQMIHASSSIGITVSSFSGNSYWEPRYSGARRILTESVLGQLKPQTSLNTYTVRGGDTLWIISQKTSSTILELMEWNQLSSDLIMPGQKLKVRNAAQFNQTNYSTLQSKKHTVVAGESLYLIAKKYGLTIENLKAWNHLNSDMIYIGQSLDLQAPVTTHKVRSGESLWILANRYGVTIKQIKELNQLHSDQIVIGQVVKIPV